MKRMKCSKCGSYSIVRDATAEWDYSSQEWMLAGTHDHNICNSCGEENCAVEELVHCDTYENELQRQIGFAGASSFNQG